MKILATCLESVIAEPRVLCRNLRDQDRILATAIRAKFFQALILALTLVGLQSCFRVGLPEHFANASIAHSRLRSARLSSQMLGHSRRPIAVVLSPASQEPAERRSIGSQYVFGFIPVTRLYFERSADFSLSELTASILASRGYDVFMTSSPESARKADFKNRHVVLYAPHFASLSINAFDLFFVRKNTIDADISMQDYNPACYPQEAQKSQAQTQNVYDSHYQMGGHVPLLSDNLRRALENQLPSLLSLASKRQERGGLWPTPIPVSRNCTEEPQGYQADDGSSMLIGLAPPQSSQEFESTLMQLAQSYGMERNMIYDKASLQRLIQRGLEHEASQQGLLPISAINLSVGALASSLPEHSRAVETTLEKIEPGTTGFFSSDEPLRVLLKMQIFEVVSGDLTPLQSQTCWGYSQDYESRDGYLSFAIEEAAGNAFKSALSGKCL